MTEYVAATGLQARVCMQAASGKPWTPPAHLPAPALCAAQMSRTALPAVKATGAVAQATALTGDHMPEPSWGSHLGRCEHLTSLLSITETHATATDNTHTRPRVEEHSHIRRGANHRGLQVGPKRMRESLLLGWCFMLCTRLFSIMTLLIEHEDQLFFRLTKPGPHRSGVARAGKQCYG